MDPHTTMLKDVASPLTPQSARVSPRACVPHLTSTASVDRSGASSRGMKCPTNQPRNGAASTAALPRTTASLKSRRSNDSFVAAVNGDLRARGLGEHGPAHLG